MSAALAGTVPETCRVWLRPLEEGAELQVDGKDEAIRLRQLLVRRGLHCTFPSPLWQRSRYSFHVTFANGMVYPEFERVLASLADVELQSKRI